MKSWVEYEITQYIIYMFSKFIVNQTIQNGNWNSVMCIKNFYIIPIQENYQLSLLDSFFDRINIFYIYEKIEMITDNKLFLVPNY